MYKAILTMKHEWMRQEQDFQDSIMKVIDYFCKEYELSYAQAIGILSSIIHQLQHEGGDEEID